MTPVVTIDSSAEHALHDIVNDLRRREPTIQTAFCMVGNRVLRTLEKANWKGKDGFFGDHWFFPTVNEAVHYCLRHREAKRRHIMKAEEKGENAPGAKTI